MDFSGSPYVVLRYCEVLREIFDAVAIRCDLNQVDDEFVFAGHEKEWVQQFVFLSTRSALNRIAAYGLCIQSFLSGACIPNQLCEVLCDLERYDVRLLLRRSLTRFLLMSLRILLIMSSLNIVPSLNR